MFDAILAALLLAADAAAVPDAGAAALLTRADAPRTAFGEGVIDLHVTVQEKAKNPIENDLKLYVSGADRSLCVFGEGKQKGRRILTVGDKVWLIVPGSSRPVPVSKSQRLMGAASFGDIARLRFADEYDGTIRGEEDGAAVIALVAKKKSAAYPTGTLWVGQADGLARRLRLSLPSKKEAKEVAFTGYQDHGRLRTMDIRDLLAAGGENVTSLTFTRYEKKPLDPKIFTPEGASALVSP